MNREEDLLIVPHFEEKHYQFTATHCLEVSKKRRFRIVKRGPGKGTKKPIRPTVLQRVRLLRGKHRGQCLSDQPFQFYLSGESINETNS